MSYLSIKNVEKTYPNGKTAIKNANIEIERGEFVIFVGPSGCGKSTLLRMIAGLETISSGKIILSNTVINNIDPAERNIAMVFQNYALYPHMTVYKNLAYGLMNRKINKAEIERRVMKTAEMLQIAEYLKCKPRELSGGQRQRVAMGRAIVRKPKLFLFDEPLSNLDAKLRNTMRLEIKSLQKSLGITTVYVTHDQVEAMTMADKIVVLSAGKIEQIGTPHEIYHKPANLFVATFMGSPAMNLLNAKLDQQELRFDHENRMITDFDLPEDKQNTKLQVGIRPECITLYPDKPQDKLARLKIYIDVVEDLGAERIVHAKIGEQKLLIATKLKKLTNNSVIYASFYLKDMYLFDRETGENISHHLKKEDLC